MWRWIKRLMLLWVWLWRRRSVRCRQPGKKQERNFALSAQKSNSWDDDYWKRA